jgi:hypothetical protein
MKIWDEMAILYKYLKGIMPKTTKD